MSIPKKRRGLDINVYVPEASPPPDRKSQPSVVMQRHTTYHSTSDVMTSSRTYYAVPASPQKSTTTRNEPTNSGSDDSPLNNYRDGNLECNFLPPGWMDPNHVHENPDGPEPVKRQRTIATVRNIFSNLTSLFHIPLG